ncbi:60S ribosomal protein L7-1 [Syzygium oleosum]|uniref:60S ribosomal protein L7-1 n=1 Tax=Syzygium oleosum TaxID=219896 RepID=UPI0011D19C7C|nr:60S ribosomal protein L7-1 [Syzygium oleosum]XP_030470975.1 60S ribosomal protein L7-1 [Syzygium oleosum]
MAEEAATAAAQPLTYVQEAILKKRKSTEELALRRRAQLQLSQKRSKQSKSSDFKMPEQFIRDYRDKELDLIRMKHRVKRRVPPVAPLNSKLLFIIRIQGKNDMHPKTKKILNNLRLRRVLSGIFVKATDAILAMLQKVEPYVTYGYPNLANVRELIIKKGFANIDKQRVPLTDNNIVEQELGKYGILCTEDIVHEIANVGPHFKEVTSFLWPFMLNKPDGGLRRTKRMYKDGGETGNREDHINELISKLN